MPQTEERLARLEADVSHIRQDISEMRVDIRELRGGLQAANDAIGGLKADMHKLETHVIKWFIGTSIGLTAMAFTVAKFVA